MYHSRIRSETLGRWVDSGVVQNVAAANESSLKAFLSGEADVFEFESRPFPGENILADSIDPALPNNDDLT